MDRSLAVGAPCRRVINDVNPREEGCNDCPYYRAVAFPGTKDGNYRTKPDSCWYYRVRIIGDLSNEHITFSCKPISANFRASQPIWCHANNCSDCTTTEPSSRLTRRHINHASDSRAHPTRLWTYERIGSANAAHGEQSRYWTLFAVAQQEH